MRAILEAVEEVYPALYRPLDVAELSTGNYLPNSHFRDWTSTSYPDKYNKISATCAKATAAGLYRGGSSSSLVSPSAADGYMFITSGNTTDAGYPRLLDLMGRTVSFYAWAYPSTADDAFLTIYTLQADGTAQTLNSTTTCPATKWTLLKLEDQTLNDDLVEIQFRFRVHTNAQTCYFDNARVTSKNTFEYLLPLDFKNGSVAEVYIQSTGYSDFACDDLRPRYWERVFGYDIIDDGTDKHLSLPYLYTKDRQIRLVGKTPLEDMSASTNALAAAKTISLDGEKLRLLIAYAKYKLYQLVPEVPAAEDLGRFETAQAKALFEYRRLSHLKMAKRPRSLQVRTW